MEGENMAISKIRRASVSDEVYNQIIDNIANKEWKPCSKLPSEVELAEMLGVSRISVRNAIQRLVGQGILESRHGEGTFVSDLSLEGFFNSMIPLLSVQKDQICELYEFRRVMETGNIRLLADTLTDEVIADLEANYEKMQKHYFDIKSFVNIDIEFHSIIAKATGNAIITNIYNSIREALYPNQLIVQSTFGTRGALKYHKLILEAIKNRDFAAAEKNMDEHMKMTIKNIKTEKQNID